MKPAIKSCIICICACVLFLMLVPAASANSAEPPRLVVIVNSPPADLTLSLRFEDGGMQEAVELYRNQTAWEAQYSFSYGMVSSFRPSLENVTLIAVSGGKTFECPLPVSMLDSYDNVITLDFEKQTVTNGQTFARSFTLVSMRVILTLIIEGLVFLAFGYRQKRSWLAFFIINLITQGALNIALNLSISGSYYMLALIVYEFLVLIIELIAFTLIIKEHGKGRTVGYVFLSNLCSLFLGGVLIAYLPV